MNKNLHRTILFLLCWILTCTALAQNKKSKFDIGFKTGINSCQFSPFSPIPDSIFYTVRNKTGFIAGIMTRYHMTSFLSLQTELLYSCKGTIYGPAFIKLPAIDEEKTRVSFQITYIEMPITILFSLPQPKFKLNGFTGLAPAYLLDGKLIFPTIYTIYDVGYVTREWEDTNRFDLGYVIGGGIDYPVGSRESMLLDIRYTIGGRHVSKTADRSKNQVLSIMVGYKF